MSCSEEATLNLQLNGKKPTGRNLGGGISPWNNMTIYGPHIKNECGQASKNTSWIEQSEARRKYVQGKRREYIVHVAIAENKVQF